MKSFLALKGSQDQDKKAAILEKRNSSSLRRLHRYTIQLNKLMEPRPSFYIFL